MDATATEARPQASTKPNSGGPHVDPMLPVVELEGVTKRYRRLVALRDTRLSIAPGEFVFVIGPSEAGKTTLLKLIHGDLRPNRGTVLVQGYRLHRRWRRFMPRLRRQVAAVFQDQRLLPDMTARGNVAFALSVADLWQPHSEVRARAQARLQEVGLGGRSSAYPHQLSGGQQRRLGIARALGHDPVLLLADEPTANLDRRNAEHVIELLEQRCYYEGTTVVVATHDVDLALSRPHRVIELRQGRLVADRPARARMPGHRASARASATRYRPRPGARQRLARAAQFVLGYEAPPPPPPRPKPDPAPRRSLLTRAGGLVQAVLGYQRPAPAAKVVKKKAKTSATGAWRPPAEVVARLSNGHANGNGLANGNGNAHDHGNGAPAGELLTARALEAETVVWRPPPRPPVSGASGTASGAPRRSRRGLRARAGRPLQVLLGYTPPPAPAVEPARPARTRAGVRAQVGKVAQFVLGYTPPPAPVRPAQPQRAGAARSRWRHPWTPVFNLGRLALGGAVTSWVRNFGTAAPALGSITLLLLLSGIVSVAGFGVRTLLNSQAAEASVLHVYLGDDATADQIGQARHQLAVTPHVQSVSYVDKAQALAQARQRPGLGQLATASDTNPFPASLTVQVDRPNDVAAVARVAAGQPGVDPQRSTSYDQGTYQRLQQFATIAAGVAAGFGLLLLAITYVVSSNAIRAAVLARKDELLTMQLVGASRWLLRVRLGVEGAMTGGLAGVLAAAVVLGVCAGAFYGARYLFVQLLPGVTTLVTIEVVVGVIAAGLCLGTVSALFAFRRLRT